ncbi:hypothetical protein BOTBODRAFT_115385 [Botryobasidium botryosum FD-172 SS1]|uniref:N-acetyltransferase domain-containing protein n=1 Tax=Botryobasidium botryosum (strain FD-172 SS1) TaxID=930990 RepID=A0A067M4M6_BOTB1|nr:hypothetical protein BOTBODRAFT_115385 [Botryobasidium botryosum FD-172 SS1]
MSAYRIRRAAPDDEPALSRICLLTGDAGVSAEPLFSRPELIGLVYAVPYLHLSNSFAFVLCTTDPDPSSLDLPGASAEEEGEERVVGYILGTFDTRAYEAELEQTWWPALREKYPIPTDTTHAYTPEDIKYISKFARPDTTNPDIAATYRAHMHIDLLPEAQRKGWGRRMIAVAADEVRKNGGRYLFLGIDPRNQAAAAFYLKVGFTRMEGHDNYFVSDTHTWEQRA